jgi:hypothetical protein
MPVDTNGIGGHSRRCVELHGLPPVKGLIEVA